MTSLSSIVRRIILSEAVASPLRSSVSKESRDLALASFMVRVLPGVYRQSDKISKIVDVETGDPLVQPGNDYSETYRYLVSLLGDPSVDSSRQSAKSTIVKKLMQIATREGFEEKTRWPFSAFNVYEERTFNKTVLPERVWMMFMESAFEHAVRGPSSPSTKKSIDTQESSQLKSYIEKLPARGVGVDELRSVVDILGDVSGFFSTTTRSRDVEDKINVMRMHLADVAESLLSAGDDEDEGFFSLREGVFNLDLDLDAETPISDVPLSSEEIDAATGAIGEDEEEENSEEVEDDTEAKEKIEDLRGAVASLADALRSDITNIENGYDMAIVLEDDVDQISLAAGVTVEG